MPRHAPRQDARRMAEGERQREPAHPVRRRSRKNAAPPPASSISTAPPTSSGSGDPPSPGGAGDGWLVGGEPAAGSGAALGVPVAEAAGEGEVPPPDGVAVAGAEVEAVGAPV